MRNTNGSEDWRTLCELASKEQDPEKLIDLIVKINQALEECRQKPRYHINANASGVTLSLSHLSSILLVSLLVFSTHVLWAQRTSTLEERAAQLPDAPSWVATGSRSQTHLHLTYKGLPLSLGQNQGQTESWMRFFPDHKGYDRRSINTNVVLNQHRGTPEVWGKKWMTFAPTFGHVHHETIHGANDLEYYGHHIPWAGSVILRIDRQAKAHPHITTVLKTVHPQF